MLGAGYFLINYELGKKNKRKMMLAERKSCGNLTDLQNLVFVVFPNLV